MSAREGEKVMEIINSYERKGRELGKQEGREEGREEAILMVAKRMKVKGKTLEEIAELTGLDIEKIKKL